MKNKIAAGIMLFAGSVAVIICLINNSSLETMLLSTFLSMFVFMIIGFIVQNIINKMNEAADQRLKAEAEQKKIEEAILMAAKEEEERLAKEQKAEEEKQENSESSGELDRITDILAAGISARNDAAANNASNKKDA